MVMIKDQKKLIGKEIMEIHIYKAIFRRRGAKKYWDIFMA